MLIQQINLAEIVPLLVPILNKYYFITSKGPRVGCPAHTPYAGVRKTLRHRLGKLMKLTTITSQLKEGAVLGPPYMAQGR